MQEKELLIKLLTSNLDFLNENIVSVIPDEYAKLAATELIGRLKDTTAILFDDINNKEQLKQIWGSFTSDPEVTIAIVGLLSSAFEKIEDERIKRALLSLLKPLVQTLAAVTDSDVRDGAQIEKIWKDFINSPEFLLFILENLEWIITKIIKNEKVRSTILKLIELFTKN